MSDILDPKPDESPMRWDLDAIFPGGSRSEVYRNFLQDLEQDIHAFAERLSRDEPSLAELVESWEDLAARLREAAAFAECLTAQDVHDTEATALSLWVRDIAAKFEAALADVDRILLATDETAFRALLKDPAGGEARRAIAPVLEERRWRAAEKLPPEQERLVAALGADGYHGWQAVYAEVAGRIQIEVEHDGRRETLSVAQVQNRLEDPERAVRERVFTAYERAWDSLAHVGAQILNHLAGYRLTLYRLRGWEDFLREPLEMNRLTRPTLEAMWAAVKAEQPTLARYLKAKAELLGLEALAWYDIDAPVSRRPSAAEQKVPYAEARRTIVRNFSAVDPEWGALALRAFREGWIEAEDRPGKRAGGFCTSFPITGVSRIFLTYGGTKGSFATLAHELGHAYHQWVVRHLPVLAQGYPMSLAETASTFAEIVVQDRLLEEAAAEERLPLLDDVLRRAVAYFMNLHARFLFEVEFYARRREGFVPREELDRLMEAAQRRAYREILSPYHPLFWFSKLHFYLTDVPFYNFPYTFGYLFAHLLHLTYLEAPASFADRYRELLWDSGRLPVETIARKHLGLDITDEGVWRRAARHAVRHVEAFLGEVHR